MARNDRRLSAVEKRLEKIAVPQKVVDRFGRYRDDPAAFARDVLGFASATRRSDGEAYQFSILRDLACSERVVIRSGHGIGKSATAAVAVIWWLLTRPMSRAIVVAPEFSRQVRAVLFSEIRKRVRQSRVRLPLRVLASRVEVEGYGATWGAVGMPATEPDRIEGQHAEGGLLLILDECKGISQDAVDALQGTQTGPDVRVLVCSTPGGPSGPYYRIWTRGGDAWVRHHIPSTDSSLVREKWVEDRRREWGEGSPLFAARVLGEFPDAGEGTLLPLHLIEAAQREALAPEEAITTLGIDVARSVSGDFNCVAAVRGGVLQRLDLWQSPDLMETVAKVVQIVATSGAQRIRVDVGGVGGGVVDRLRELGYEVQAVAFGGKADDARRFTNQRAAMFWGLREALERGLLVLPDDDDLVADLCALRYQFAQDGRIALEGKDECRKRLGRSPDRADALALAVLPDASALVDMALVAEAFASGQVGLSRSSVWDCDGTGGRWWSSGGANPDDPYDDGSVSVLPPWPT
jgi:hypothetical protein